MRNGRAIPSTFCQERGLTALKTRSRSQAFTLIETLVVIAIGTLLVAISILSDHSLLDSQSLSSSGNMVTDLINQGRQNSIAKRTLTALILVTKSGNPNWDNRLFILFDLEPNQTTLSQLTKWHQLPAGIMVDPNTRATFQNTPASFSYSFGPLSIGGTSLPLSAVSYQIFLPNGELFDSSSPPILHLVESKRVNGDYYDITLNPYTGIPIVNRP